MVEEPELVTNPGPFTVPQPPNSRFRIQRGERFGGRYLVDEVIGVGGMSVVFSAYHSGWRRKVAIKVLCVPEDARAEWPAWIGRFSREARAASSLLSEHVARILDIADDEEGRRYIVMEYLEGTSLRSVIGPNLSVSNSVGYIIHACEAIGEAHSLGIIHRDLKPENLFLTHRRDGTPIVKVLDFGISKVVERTGSSGGDRLFTLDNSILGTVPYMSPEQLRTPSQVDAQSDIWSLGVILFELLTGKLPFAGRSGADVLAGVLTREVPNPREIRPDIPRDLAELVVACLAKRPADRVAGVAALSCRLVPWAPRWARSDAASGREREAGARLDATKGGGSQSRKKALAPAAQVSEEHRLTSTWHSSESSRRSYRRAAWLGGGFTFSLGLILAFQLRTSVPDSPSLRGRAQEPLPVPTLQPATMPPGPPGRSVAPEVPDAVAREQPGSRMANLESPGFEPKRDTARRSSREGQPNMLNPTKVVRRPRAPAREFAARGNNGVSPASSTALTLPVDPLEVRR